MSGKGVSGDALTSVWEWSGVAMASLGMVWRCAGIRLGMSGNGVRRWYLGMVSGDALVSVSGNGISPEMVWVSGWEWPGLEKAVIKPCVWATLSPKNSLKTKFVFWATCSPTNSPKTQCAGPCFGPCFGLCFKAVFSCFGPCFWTMFLMKSMAKKHHVKQKNMGQITT